MECQPQNPEIRNNPETVLCLERGIARFPRFYSRCPLKMHPVRAYGRALENSRFKPCFRI